MIFEKVYKMSENSKKLEQSVILMGIKHCGKSTQARALANYFKCDFFDTDDLITEQTGKTPREIFTEFGNEGFMQAELKACETLKNSKKLPAIIATGGGICNNLKAVEILKSLGGKIIFLQVQEKVASDRIVREAVFKDGKLSNIPAYIAKKNPHNLDDVRTIFYDFYAERVTKYKQIADLVVDVSNGTIKENTAQLLKLLQD